MAPKATAELEQASARGEAALDQAAIEFFEENSAEDGDAVRAQLTDRDALERYRSAPTGLRSKNVGHKSNARRLRSRKPARSEKPPS
jgi:hypothetical protein